MRSITRTAVVLLAIAGNGTALAAVSAEEAKQIGITLMPWGAEKAGNKEGTIPEFTGDRVSAPANYDPKHPGQYPDPWNDKPLYSITAQNYAQYADHLSEGHMAMFKKYPAYRMDIYKSHRTAQYPKYVVDNSIKNATSCKAVNDELRLEGCYGGVPFPIPKTGNQVVWDHELSFGLVSGGGEGRAYFVSSDGKLILTAEQTLNGDSGFFDPNRTTPAEPQSISGRFRVDFTGPPRKSGEKLLGIGTLDQISPGIRIWQYLPGQRRVKLAPDLSYDTPSPTGGGASTVDEILVYNGAQDRYDMKLMGKKEIYLQYNTFRITDPKVCPAEVYFKQNFPNPDCIRWELHRTWVVDAKVKPQFRHILPHRIMYFDEDVPGAGTGVGYDASGSIFRVSEAPYFPTYDLGYGHAVTAGVIMDLNTGAYYQSTFYAYPGGGIRETPKRPDAFYSPDGLAGEGIR